MLKLVPLLTVVITLTPLVASAAQPQERYPETDPRVRPYDARSATLLLEGIERSDTLRALVDRLERLDVIVYLEMQPTLRRKLAGTLTWLTATASRRYVRISLNPELMRDAVIAALAHELQHALEVAEAPEVRSAAALEAYYRQHGLSTTAHVNGWDTLAARQIGDIVRRQLAGARTTFVAESIQQFYPEEWHIVYRRARSMLPP